MNVRFLFQRIIKRVRFGFAQAAKAPVAVRRLLWSAPLLALVCCLAGCNAGHSNSPSLGLHLYGGLNTSSSDRKELAWFAQQSAKLMQQMQRGKDHITLFRLDSDTQEFMDGDVGASMEQTQYQLAAQLKPISKRDNTFEDTFWAQVANRAQRDSGPVVVILWTDGFIEGSTPARQARLREAVKRLAKAPHLSGVAIVGAKPATWARLRKDLAPLQARLGADRFLISSDTDTNSAPLTRLLTPAP